MNATCHPERPNHGHGFCKKCYYIEHREDILRRAKLDYKNRTSEIKDRIYTWHLKRTYGISRNDYEQLLYSQNGVCFLCHKPPCKDKFKRLHVDHDHITGRVRGLLCRGCNGLVGWYESHKDQLKIYLKESQ